MGPPFKRRAGICRFPKRRHDHVGGTPTKKSDSVAGNCPIAHKANGFCVCTVADHLHVRGGGLGPSAGSAAGNCRFRIARGIARKSARVPPLMLASRRTPSATRELEPTPQRINGRSDTPGIDSQVRGIAVRALPNEAPAIERSKRDMISYDGLKINFDFVLAPIDFGFLLN
jgi:hypothetical protein